MTSSKSERFPFLPACTSALLYQVSKEMEQFVRFRCVKAGYNNTKSLWRHRSRVFLLFPKHIGEGPCNLPHSKDWVVYSAVDQAPIEGAVKRFLSQVYEQKANLRCSLQLKQAICQRTSAEFSGILKLWEGVDTFCQIYSCPFIFVNSHVIHCQYWMLTSLSDTHAVPEVNSELRAWLPRYIMKKNPQTLVLIRYWSGWIFRSSVQHSQEGAVSSPCCCGRSDVHIN